MEENEDRERPEPGVTPNPEPEESSEAPTEALPGPKRLLRSRDDRMLAGVAGGLGEYFGVDPIIMRIAFGISVLFGGLGILVYLAAFLFVPEADGSDNPQAPAQRSRTTAVLAIVFLCVIAIPAIGGGIFWGDGPGWIFWIALPIAAAIAGWAAVRDRGGWTRGRGAVWAVFVGTAAGIGFLSLLTAAALLTAVGEGVAVALGLLAAGVILVALALAGAGRWLILPVAAIAIGASGAAAADLDLGGGIGEQINRPTSVRAIPEEGYELGIGRLVVDLRGLDWRNEVIDVELDQGIGEAVVAVPSRVCVIGSAHVGAGELRVVGEKADGFDVDVPPAAPSPERPQLRFSGDLELGSLRVLNDDAVEVDESGDERLDSDVLRDRNAEACGR